VEEVVVVGDEQALRDKLEALEARLTALERGDRQRPEAAVEPGADRPESVMAEWVTDRRQLLAKAATAAAGAVVGSAALALGQASPAGAASGTLDGAALDHDHDADYAPLVHGHAAADVAGLVGVWWWDVDDGWPERPSGDPNTIMVAVAPDGVTNPVDMEPQDWRWTHERLTSPAAPATPTDLTLVGNFEGFSEVTWTDPPDSDLERIEVLIDGELWTVVQPGVETVIYSGPTVAVDLTLIAYDTSNNPSDETDPLVVTPGADATRPDPPKDLTVQTFPTSLILEWINPTTQDNGAQALGVDIETQVRIRETDGPGEWSAWAAAEDDDSNTFTGLDPGSSYDMEVRVFKINAPAPPDPNALVSDGAQLTESTVADSAAGIQALVDDFEANHASARWYLVWQGDATGSNGDRVATWTPRAPGWEHFEGRPFVQTVTSPNDRRPIIASSTAPHGKRCLYFERHSGTEGDSLRSSGGGDTPPTPAVPLRRITIFRLRNVTNNNIVAGSSLGKCDFTVTNGTFRFSAGAANLDSQVTADTDWHVLDAVHQGNASTSISVDGSKEGAGYRTGNAGSNVTNTYTLGRNSKDTLAGHTDVEIAFDMVIDDDALLAHADVTELIEAIADEYGITYG
jgi:hypothetical protein